MRIGTWNLAGHWGAGHRDLLSLLGCDVLLLTEVATAVELPGYQLHATTGFMAAGRCWAAVASRVGLRPLADPHGASVMAEVDGLRMCASILPWRSCGRSAPWTGLSTTEKTANAVADIEAARPDVWGGDWNHRLCGTEYAGSGAGAERIRAAVERLGLVVPTVGLSHRLTGSSAIDHIAVPRSWDVVSAQRVSGVVGGVALSDHDAYVVTGVPAERLL